MISDSDQQAQFQEPSQSQATADLPADLVRQVTERVYALWLKEQQIERERRRSASRRWSRRS